jgi:UDP-N-acetylmuramoylalanine--D-glutamate ligase
MDELVLNTADRIKSVILIGQDREMIAQAVLKHLPKTQIFRIDLKSDGNQLMLDVVKQAVEIAKAGDTVLLAPACASMDQFESYADRGQAFANAVRAVVQA